MSIVLDANLVIVAVTSDPRKIVVQEQIENWINARTDLHAPSLLPYEVASGLVQLIGAGVFPSDRLPAAWQAVLALPITYHPLNVYGERAVNIARQLHQANAYDAAYIVLAQDLDAELWTLDGRLARNAIGLGYPVHLLG